MKDFDITEQQPFAPLGDPGSIRSSLTIIGYTVPPIGTDEDGDFIYGERTPEDEERVNFFRAYRVIMTKHTKSESERRTPDDGALRKVVQSSYFDLRDPEQEQNAKHAAVGMAVCFALGI